MKRFTYFFPRARPRIHKSNVHRSHRKLREIMQYCLELNRMKTSESPRMEVIT